LLIARHGATGELNNRKSGCKSQQGVGNFHDFLQKNGGRMAASLATIPP
jgi:hypothetical protein